MDAEQVAALRAVLAPSGWLERTVALARALRRLNRILDTVSGPATPSR